MKWFGVSLLARQGNSGSKRSNSYLSGHFGVVGPHNRLGMRVANSYVVFHNAW